MNSDKREIAVKVSNVKKMYKLGQIGGGTLQADLQSWWAKVRGKEDPNSIIGSEERSKGDTFMALNGVDLTIYKGEAVGIIGSNGAGKSTLLKLLSRVTAPTEGEIDLYGRITSMLEVGTGFNPEMTGRENVYLNGAILGMTKAEIDAKMEQIIEFSEVREFIDTPVKRYSSGMFVKLAFSVAAHLDSEIMIMDEVLAVGDMAFQKKCLDKMRDAAKKDGRTVLYVSHNMNTIRKLCDRCIVLNKGKVIFEGAVEQAIEVYMGTSVKLEVPVNLSNTKRASEFSNLPVTINLFDLINNKKGIYNVGDKMFAKLDYKSIVNVEDAYLRVIIKALDGTSVTMTTLSKGFPIQKDKTETIEFEIDISRIVPGKYNLNFVLYQVDELGNYVNLDGVKDVFTFEILSVFGFNNNMPWTKKYWGYFYCDDLILNEHY
ncbi:MAG: ABC transporter ATP-binding protein [Ruminococcus sp.]|nr:ABC transporter ATP-binding protein [Ruminococcus sp.]